MAGGNRPDARQLWLISLLLAALAVVPYLPSLRGEFLTWDDNINFLENFGFRGLGWDNLRWMWSTTRMGHYIPLTWMTFGLDYTLWGMNPTGYHSVNLVLHAINTVLLFFLGKDLLERAGIPHPGMNSNVQLATAALAALFFAVHPLRVESVSWITERRDALSLLFMLVSIQQYLRYVTTGTRRGYVASLLLFMCALLSKGIAVTLPAVLLLLNLFPLRRIEPRRLRHGKHIAVELLPFFALSGAFSLLSVVALTPPAQLDPVGKVVVSVYSLVWYLWKTIVPTGLAPLYEMPERVNPLAPRFLLAYAGFAILCLALWRFRTRHAVIGAALAFVILIFPLLGVVQNGPQIVADRYTYHASPALGLLVAGSAAWIAGRKGLVILGAFIAAMFPLTWKQARIWRDSGSLWSRVVEIDSTSSVGHIAMGSLLFDRGRVLEAVDHYRLGLRYDPDYADGYNNLGVALAQLGRTPEAVEQYERAVAIRPGYADALNNLGIALARDGKLVEAIAKYRDALAADSTFSAAHTNWGNALVRLGRISEALPHYAAAVTLNPTDAFAELNWGAALAQQGDLEQAIPHFDRVLALQPDNADARAFRERAGEMLRARTPMAP
ncbi:MAG TPA: tetratricopeptide repeat protein [Gemmatimonadaceae bacterium]|nr:tetratricopeptide repeat protein [Gemmatimonadaceae bacterium]